MALSDLGGRKRKNVGKGDPYECGMEPQGDARLRLSIQFYLVAVLFILFDVESVFLVLWAVGAKGFGETGVGVFVFAEIVAFVGLLGLQPTLPLMAVPSLGQHFLMTSLLRGEPPGLANLAVSAVSSLALGALLAWVAGRLYERESILG